MTTLTQNRRSVQLRFKRAGGRPRPVSPGRLAALRAARANRPGREQLQHARAAGYSIGLDGVVDAQWSSTSVLQYAFEQGQQIGLQAHAVRNGERRGLAGHPDHLPVWIHEDFAAEYATGWDRGHLLFLDQCDALAQLGLPEDMDDAAAGLVTDRDMYPHGGVS